MLYTVVKPNSYQDSINLMLLTNRINALDGVVQSQIMMGTDANKDIYEAAGLLTPEAQAAAPSDMVIVVDAADASVVDVVLDEGVPRRFVREEADGGRRVRSIVLGGGSCASSRCEHGAVLHSGRVRRARA